MKTQIRYFKVWVLISFFNFIQFQGGNAQSFYTASNTDIGSNCGSTGILHTNNDCVSAANPLIPISNSVRSVIVYDGSNPGLYWDDGSGNKGHTSLGSAIAHCIAVNPDVSLSQDGNWAIAVYEDIGNNEEIIAEVFRWNGGVFAYQSKYYFTLYTGGKDVKIDGHKSYFSGKDNWAVVWRKNDDLALFASCGNLPNFPAQPLFDPMKNVLLQATGISRYSAPDVTILNDSVYFTYAEENMDGNTITVESQLHSDIVQGILNTPPTYDLQYSSINYIYDLPRITSFFDVYYSYYDWAVVAQTPNLTTGGAEIHGFVKNWGNPVNTAPFVYNDGSLAVGTPNDIT
ncbi:MAG: hypothetical protein JSS90_02230 [Bacteroidetes bacterium]|nr:hypothetical protein [Bacteroidota bacterium]